MFVLYWFYVVYLYYQNETSITTKTIEIMKTIADLKVGTELTKKNQNTKYGVYSNIVVSEIKETKTGRLHVFYTYTYTSPSGEVSNGIEKISNAPIKANTALSLYGF